MKHPHQTIRLSKLPFYWRVKNHIHDRSPVPDYLPLELAYDERLGLFMQKRNTRVLKYLNTIYTKTPNIGHNQEISNWKNYYGNDLYDFIIESVKQNSKPIRNILEIGSGGCAILYRLKKLNFHVLGIDPSPFSRREGNKMGIQVIQDFFPSKNIHDSFDLIYHSNVLEHITDPLACLISQYKQLNPGGLLIMAVPDCTGPLKHGDTSILYHQHLSYFDAHSLRTIVRLAGFSHIRVKKATFGGNLYCVAQKINRKVIQIPQNFNNSKKILTAFTDKHETLRGNFALYIHRILHDKMRSLGFYAPLRALPYLTELNLRSGYRFFDDTSYWHNKYFDGVNIPFENFEDLKKHPVTDILIMSPTFSKIIASKIRAHFGRKIAVRTITDLYE